MVKKYTKHLLIAGILALSLSFSWAESREHSVQSGETLFSIALDYDISLEQLQLYNRMEDDRIYPGMLLKLPPRDRYVVQPGDNLSSIAVRLGLDMSDLMSWNHLENDRILVGQELITSKKSIELPAKEYSVQSGDTLWSISRRFTVSLEELLRVNRLDQDQIVPGMRIKLPLGASAGEQLAAFSLEAVDKGPWFGSEPKRNQQPSLNYGELPSSTPRESYRQAREVLRDLDEMIRKSGPVSNELSGWRIVIDPGHGGLDPGAVVETRDGMGNAAYVVEDEYAYEISIRLYALLKQHGADATLTIISPNHHIRHTPDASQTFVNQKNEVFNLASLNQGDSWGLWPKGGTESLRKRKQVAAEWIGRNNRKTLFISIHCDNSPEIPHDSAVLSWGINDNEMASSRELAELLSEYTGGLSTHRDQELEVLKNNPAQFAVLLEVRNISQTDNSWILRKENLRNQEVMGILEGIKAFINTK